MGGPFFLLFGIVSRWLQSMGEDHFSKQCVKLRNWIPLFLGCFFGDRVVCKKKKGNGKRSVQQRRRTLGKKENFSRISYVEKEEGFLYVYIYIYIDSLDIS